MPLYVLATPIGNLSDISPRARRCLEEAGLLAVEDTRVTRKLLHALGIEASRMISYRGYNEARQLGHLLDTLREDQRVVLVSDAGTPNVSDPGRLIVEACHQEGLKVISVPGPSALASALSVSGLPTAPVQFLGFPPRKAGPLRRWLEAAMGQPGSLVLYESPKRTLSTLRVLAELDPQRQVCLCRELTKQHEEICSLPVLELIEHLEERSTLRGEVTLVVGPGRAQSKRRAPLKPSEHPPEGLKQCSEALAQLWGVPKRDIYQALLKLREDFSE